MRWLWHIIRRLFSFLTGTARSSGPNQPDAARRMDDYRRWLEEHGGTRLTTTRVLGGQAASDGVMYNRDHIETEDDYGNPVQIEAYEARQCSFGHLIDQEVRAGSTCQKCGAIMCTLEGTAGTEGCAARCCSCGNSCCSRHRVSYNIGSDRLITYCDRCSWRHWWRKFWGLYP